MIEPDVDGKFQPADGPELGVLPCLLLTQSPVWQPAQMPDEAGEAADVADVRKDYADDLHFRRLQSRADERIEPGGILLRAVPLRDHVGLPAALAPAGG